MRRIGLKNISIPPTRQPSQHVTVSVHASQSNDLLWLLYSLNFSYVFFRVHPSLSKISKDWTLWKRLRFDTINLSIENMCTSQLNDLVTHIDIKSDKVSSFQSSVSQRFMVQIKAKCPKLIHLGLYKQLFDAIKVSEILLV